MAALPLPPLSLCGPPPGQGRVPYACARELGAGSWQPQERVRVGNMGIPCLLCGLGSATVTAAPAPLPQTWG